eukprot:GHVO01007443.1.p1 GENE.GHVO01007443.1~~GHVO01007443.1.p1  ORF type:complete len:106 (+),score=6.06 GHVO01007443.1:382-699(+)
MGLPWDIQTDAAVVTIGASEFACAGKLKHKMGSSFAAEANAKAIRAKGIFLSVVSSVKLRTDNLALTHETMSHRSETDSETRGIIVDQRRLPKSRGPSSETLDRE